MMLDKLTQEELKEFAKLQKKAASTVIDCHINVDHPVGSLEAANFHAAMMLYNASFDLMTYRHYFEAAFYLMNVLNTLKRLEYYVEGVEAYEKYNPRISELTSKL